MLNKTALSPDQEKKVSAINLSSTMLMETVNNILDVSALENNHSAVLLKVAFKPFNILTEAVDSMQFMAEKKSIFLVFKLDGDENLTVNGDAFKLKQIMVNLLSNAIKYTDAGGVTVTAVVTTHTSQNSLLDVSITDTGIGIPKDQQANLFTRYYQTGGSQTKPGTGLGLFFASN